MNETKPTNPKHRKRSKTMSFVQHVELAALPPDERTALLRTLRAAETTPGRPPLPVPDGWTDDPRVGADGARRWSPPS